MVRINSISFGEIEIDGKTYYSDVVVWWDGRVEHKTSSHEFGMNEFLGLLGREPDSIVIGTGQSGCVHIAEEVKQTAEDKGIKIFADESPRASDIFNALVRDEKKVVAVIHLTC